MLMATAAAPPSQPAPAWNLSDLYDSIDDPRITADVTAAREQAQAFEKQYAGRIATAELTAATLKQALDEYEAILRLQTRPIAYAHLRFSADTADSVLGAFFQRMQEERTASTRHLIFFDLEIGKIPEETFNRIIAGSLLEPYRHYLLHERELAAHYLSEPEEKVWEELANTGRRAFGRLFSEITSRMKFTLRKEGEEPRELTQSEVLALLYEPDRETRRAAAAAVTETLSGEHHVLTYIFNTLLQEKSVSDRLRRYETPEASRHLDNELEPEVVQHVVDVCVQNYDLVAEYYGVKRQLLGLDELTHYDRYAPLLLEKSEISFPDAQKLVLDSFQAFSPKVYEAAEPFFSRGWIDAELRPGKRGGAFCSSVTPDLHPYVFMNYTGKPRDVMTLAHELGHAVHGMLARQHHYLDFHPVLPLAETASVFGEMLVFDALRSRLESPRERVAMLAEKIEDTFATVFRQVTMFRFEQEAHRRRREEGELPVERLNEIWQTTMQEMFGDSLKLGDEHRWWWLYIPHVFNTPFYVYAYAFGELLVLALYARYQREGAPFIEKYLALLAAGGSQRPTEIVRALDIDIADPAFWQGGMDLIRTMVAEAKALAAEVGRLPAN
jgi:oligoendopeptidase F